jgi:transcriptional regulator with XRE-family HTH domain
MPQSTVTRVAGDRHGDADRPAERLGQRIRRLRHAAGLTQQHLAAPRYTGAFLAAVEAGTRSPSPEALEHIAARLGVAADDLRFGRPAGIAQDLGDRLATARRQLSAGSLDAAERALGEVRRLADNYRLPDLAGWASYYAAEVRLHRGATAAAAADYDRIAATLPAGHPQLRAAVLARQAYCLLVGGEAARAVAVLETGLRALRAEAPVQPDAELRLINALMYTFLELGWRQRARRLEAEASQLLPRVGNEEWIAQFYAVAGQLRRDGELAEVDRYLAEAARRYSALGLTREIALCHWARGYVLRRAGQPGAAAAELSRAREILAAVGAVTDHAGATLELAEARRREGALAEAEELAKAASVTATDCGHHEAMAEADRLLGMLRAARGDGVEAERLLTRAVERYERAGLMGDVVSTCRLLGELLSGQGHRDRAAEVLRRGLRAAERLR